MANTKKDTIVTVGTFRVLAQSICNGCDLITGEENKLTTDDVLAAGTLTIEDFALCTIDEKEVGVVTFAEKQGKYYWGGKSLSNMVRAFCTASGGEEAARAAYAEETDKVQVTFEKVKTQAKNDFVKVTVL